MCRQSRTLTQNAPTKSNSKTTNLVTIIEVEVGTLELGLGDLPEPVHRRAKGDVGRVCRSRSTSEESYEFAKGVDNYQIRITAHGEQTRTVVVGDDCCFHRITHGVAEVMTTVRLRSRPATDRGEHGEATFDNEALEIAFAVLVGRLAYPLLGEDASEFEETFVWIFEIGCWTDSGIHQARELATTEMAGF